MFVLQSRRDEMFIESENTLDLKAPWEFCGSSRRPTFAMMKLSPSVIAAPRRERVQKFF